MYCEESGINKVLLSLNERAKELNCVYQVDEICNNDSLAVDLILHNLLKIIPNGWQYPTICEVRILFENKEYKTTDFKESEWMQSSNIFVYNEIKGKIEIAYTQFIRIINNSQFLPEEKKLLSTIACRVSNFITRKKMEAKIKELQMKIDNIKL